MGNCCLPHTETILTASTGCVDRQMPYDSHLQVDIVYTSVIQNTRSRLKLQQ